MHFCVIPHRLDYSEVTAVQSFTGNRAVLAIPREIKKLMKLKSAAGRYDALFALTYMLNYYDAWVTENDHFGESGQFDEAILLLGEINDIDTTLASIVFEVYMLLGETWKTLLTYSNEELKIDAEFTREGVKALLNMFNELVSFPCSSEVVFAWK